MLININNYTSRFRSYAAHWLKVMLLRAILMQIFNANFYSMLHGTNSKLMALCCSNGWQQYATQDTF